MEVVLICEKDIPAVQAHNRKESTHEKTGILETSHELETNNESEQLTVIEYNESDLPNNLNQAVSDNESSCEINTVNEVLEDDSMEVDRHEIIGREADVESDKEQEETSRLHEIKQISPVKRECEQCKKFTDCSYIYVDQSYKDRYLCTEMCITDYRVEHPGCIVTYEKYVIIEISATKMTCSECEKEKCCYFYCQCDGERTYYCSEICLESMMANEKDKYTFIRQRITVLEMSPKASTCFNCNETKPCSFSFGRYGKRFVLCNMNCVEDFKSKEHCKCTVLLYCKETRKAAAISTQNSSQAVKEERECTFIRDCMQCSSILTWDTSTVLTWETMDFCNEVCLGRYQNRIGDKCANCKNTIQHTSLGKYCVRFGYDICQFCNSGCLEEFKRGLKICCYYQRDISAGHQGFLAPVGDKGQFKDFCSRNCLEKFDQMCKNPVPQPVWAKCAVCSLEKATNIEVEVNENTGQRLCSDPCFAAFKFVNNIFPDQCTWCKKYFERNQSKCFTIYENTKPSCFCSKSCMNVFISNSRYIVPCKWCKVKKYNFDMIKCTQPSGQTLMMCSLHCLNLYQVSLSAVSSRSDSDEDAPALQHGAPSGKRRRRRTPSPPPPAPAPSASPQPLLIDRNASRLVRGKRRALRTRDGVRGGGTAGRGRDRQPSLDAEAPADEAIEGQSSDCQIPCPPLHGVSAVPPPSKTQPCEVLPSLENTVADIVDDVTAGTSHKMTANRPLLGGALDVTKRKSHISQSSDVIQVTHPPVNPVSTDVESIGFTPQSSTSGTAPASSLSTTYDEIDVDIERKFPEPDDSGSEIEDNNLYDNSLRPRNISDYRAEFDAWDENNLAKDIQRIGAEADVALRAMAAPEDGDLLVFDWQDYFNNFKGVQETFTEPSGPTFEVTGLTPLKVFEKIWDGDIIDHIVRETNRYAHQLQAKVASKTKSRMSRWRDTTREEIRRFFSIIMLQSFVVNNVQREYWYPSIEQLRIRNFGKCIPFNRFQLLRRCLHFADNTSLPENPSKLDKVLSVIEHLNKKFSSLYLPEQSVAIDESLLLWNGRLSLAQSIATKRTKVGIKSCELCESRTGYLWRMVVHSSKRHVEAPQEAIEGDDVGQGPERATSQIAYNLMRPLFGKGHTVVMDNFYNAPLLSRLLKTKHKTDTIGPLRLNREFVPENIKCKNKENMRTGEVCFSTTKDLSVVVWKDQNVVTMMSTYHHPEVAGKDKYGYYKHKPKVVQDYNRSMGGVDHKNQMLHAFPIERVRRISWYKKLFRRLLNVSVHNALVIYNHHRTRKTQLGNRDFRLQLVREMLQTYSLQALSTRSEPPPPIALSQMHLPAKNQKKRRCKLCYAAKVQRSTVWRCSVCQVNLCIEGCYKAYHAKYVLSKLVSM